MNKIAWIILLSLAFSAPSFAQKKPTEKPKPQTVAKVSLTQAQAFNCDFDDNILFSSAKIMVWDPKSKLEIPVSTQQWAIVKNQLGKVGEWKERIARKESFRYFRDDSELGDDVVKLQVEQALDSRGKEAIAPSFAAMREALGNSDLRARFYIITARENSPSAILKGFEVLLKRGLIASLPLEENIFPVGWAGLPEQFRGDTVAGSKAKVMMKLLDNLELVPMPTDATLVEDREGKGKAKLHLWGFSDDDYDNFSKAKEVLSREVAKGRWPNIKVSLFFTGTNNPAEMPRAEIIQSNGQTRAARATEATRMGHPAT